MRRSVLVEQCRYEGSANVSNCRIALYSEHVEFDVYQNKWPGFLSVLHLHVEQAFYKLTKTVRQFNSSPEEKPVVKGRR